MKKSEARRIEVWADWVGIAKPTLVGELLAGPSRGKEIFSFEYSADWLEGSHAQNFDPSLQQYKGRQYASEGGQNFGAFLDSAPDRWGRFLMQRREAQLAREEQRAARSLWESDYLLGVFDGHRMGALRFRADSDGPFLDDNRTMASPPWTSLRELEKASLQLEREGAESDPNYSKWLRMLIAPGGSLGGARPKASVVDEQGHLWIAKFPSQKDTIDVGAWEEVVHKLASEAGVKTSVAQSRAFSTRNRTFLTRRFDRTDGGERIHFASALTLLQRNDGEAAAEGASYLELAEFITQQGAQTDVDLEQLWRRIIFFVCVSNSDDHLRNHGFLLTPTGWVLAPAYDMNPVETGDGLKLNISEVDNSQDLELAREVAKYFRVKSLRANEIIKKVVQTVKKWRSIATAAQISSAEQDRMARAFRVADAAVPG